MFLWDEAPWEAENVQMEKKSMSQQSQAKRSLGRGKGRRRGEAWHAESKAAKESIVLFLPISENPD